MPPLAHAFAFHLLPFPPPPHEKHPPVCSPLCPALLPIVCSPRPWGCRPSLQAGLLTRAEARVVRGLRVSLSRSSHSHALFRLVVSRLSRLQAVAPAALFFFGLARGNQQVRHPGLSGRFRSTASAVAGSSSVASGGRPGCRQKQQLSRGRTFRGWPVRFSRSRQPLSHLPRRRPCHLTWAGARRTCQSTVMQRVVIIAYGLGPQSARWVAACSYPAVRP